MYSSPNIITMIKLKKSEKDRVCSSHEGKRNAYRILVGNPEGNNHFEAKEVDGRITLSWVLKMGWYVLD
jgi:hypothetical protein